MLKSDHNNNASQNRHIGQNFPNNNEINCGAKERGKVQSVNNIIFLLLLGWIAVEDLKHRRIPNFLVICLFLWGIYSRGMTGEWNSFGKRGITGRRKYADFLYCIPQRNRCRGCEITDSGGILRGVRKNLGAIVFVFLDGSGMGNIMQKGGSSGNLRISGRRRRMLGLI